MGGGGIGMFSSLYPFSLPLFMSRFVSMLRSVQQAGKQEDDGIQKSA
jgi:hypothetical protein